MKSATRDSKVRECARILQNTALLAKLSACNLVVLEAKYHAKCRVGLYNKVERKESAKRVSEYQICLDFNVYVAQYP